jgi:hypothetical protein
MVHAMADQKLLRQEVVHEKIQRMFPQDEPSYMAVMLNLTDSDDGISFTMHTHFSFYTL